MQQIEADGFGVRAIETGGQYYLEFACRHDDDWVPVLATGLVSHPSIFTLDRTLLCEDPWVEWMVDDASQVERAAAFFSAATVSPDGRALILSGTAGSHTVEETITIPAPGRIHVTVTDHISVPAGNVRRDSVIDVCRTH